MPFRLVSHVTNADMNFLGDKGPNYSRGLLVLRTHHFRLLKRPTGEKEVCNGEMCACVRSPAPVCLRMRQQLCHCLFTSVQGGDQDKHPVKTHHCNCKHGCKVTAVSLEMPEFMS